MAAKRKSQSKRRLPAVKEHLAPPYRSRGAGVGISVPIILPVTLTPPYTITVLETRVQSLNEDGRRRSRRTGPEGLEYDDPQPPYDDPQPPYLVKLNLKISKGGS